jgi:hypothetical protein
MGTGMSDENVFVGGQLQGYFHAAFGQYIEFFGKFTDLV